MQIPISSQAEYDSAVKTGKHLGNELVIQNTSDFITVRTDATVGRNGRCKTEDGSAVTVTARENGIVTAGGKTDVVGYGNANIIAKGNCKITLYDSAFGNCYGHCKITLKGESKVSADGNCTVHAYDKSYISATGSTKVYSFQSSTAKGSGVSAIDAKDNCIVYASANCSVKAADNCLVVADKYAKITAKDNCLIMSVDNPDNNITVFDKCEHLKLENINEKNIVSALKQMAQSKAAAERPYVALGILKDNIPPQRKGAVNRRLELIGIKDHASAKDYLYSLIEAEPASKKQPPAENLERQLEAARKAGYVQGVCECVAAVGSEKNMGTKLLSEMNVNKDMAKKYANPETYKTLEEGIFARKPEQKLEQARGVKR